MLKSLFNKVAGLMARWPATLLQTDSNKGDFLWNLWNFWWASITCEFTKNCTPSLFFFQRTSPQVQNSNIEKCILMAASEYKFILEIFLNGCFSKAAAKIYLFQKFFTHIVHFLLWCHFKEEQVLMIFFSKGFGTKCKYTELALNFNQNSILVKKTHSPFILVE